MTHDDTDECLLRTSRYEVVRRTVRREDGSTVQRHVIVHPGSVVLLPLLPDGRVVLIRNQRASVKRTLWELPAGTRERGEEPVVTAARELEEETGYRASRLTPLCAFYPAPGVSDEHMHAFVAEGLVATAQDLDEGESISVHPLPLSEVRAMIFDGRIEDAKSIAVLLFAAAALNLPAGAG